MASETEIASNALTKLGDEPITSIADDETQRAKLCRRYYYNVRDAVLRAYPWKCAITQKALAADVAAPLFGYSFKFQIPNLPYCLRVLKIKDDLDYDIKGRYIHCDESSIIIEYIARITDPGLFDSLLQEAIECRLSAELAYPITGNPTLIKAMWDLYGAKLREARTMDGMEAPEAPWESNALIEVR